MSPRFRTSVDTLCIVDGIWQEKASNLSVVEYSSIVPDRRGRGHLYILVETIGSFPNHAQLQQRLISVAQEYYRASGGSITAGMRLAIKAANAFLFEENLNAPREQRGIAGMTCMVLKDQDAYIGQLGPALLYHVAKGEFQHLPRESTWLSSEKLQDVDISKHPPLGLRRDIEPDLFHIYVREGDVFILASTSLFKLASDDEIAHAVLHRGAHTVRENLEALAGGRDLSMLIIEVLRADQAPVEPEEERVRPPSIAAQRVSLWARISSTLRNFLIPVSEERERPEQLEQGEEFKEEEAEGFSWAVDFKRSAESVWRTLTRLWQGLGALLARVLPEGEPGRRARPPFGYAQDRRDAHRMRAGTVTHADRRWLWVAVLIPVVVILLFALTRFQYERSRQAHFRQLLQAVQDAKASAEASPAAAEQRAKLTQALTLLDEALQLKPQDQGLVAERQATQDWLDRINHVSRIFYFGELKEFPDIEGAKSQLSAVIVHSIDVYVLDLGTDRVYKYLLNETRDSLQALPGDPVLLRKGDQHGQVMVDELLDIAWMEAGGQWGTSNLLILDKKGHIFEYDPAVGLKAFPTADSSAWREPVAAATYYNRLYLLDPRANRVLKYSLTNVGYDGPPSDYFKVETSANVSNAVDMAIDGNVYILHSDGMISKYREGTSVPFSQSNLDEPLRTPCCIFATGFLDEEGYVYVADVENQRIVQFSKGGEFIRQFRSRDPGYMNELRSLFVDEAQKKLYLINGNKLYLVNVPL